jgi:hypothetical protein
MNFNDLTFFRKGYDFLLQLSGKPAGTKPEDAAAFLEKGIKGLAMKLEILQHIEARALTLQLEQFIDRNLLCALALDVGITGSIKPEDFVLLTWAPNPNERCPCAGCQAKFEAEQAAAEAEKPKVVVPQRKLVLV